MKSSNQINNLLDPLSTSSKNIESINKSLENQRKVFYLNEEDYKYENVLKVIDEIKGSPNLRNLDLIRSEYKIKTYINYSKDTYTYFDIEDNEPQKPIYIAFHYQTNKENFEGGEFIFHSDGTTKKIKPDNNMIIFFNILDVFKINKIKNGSCKVTIIKFY
tara:strand:+ start:405 stop:887 length:483 start_codon:yes stop_codon:yes gene_type:complete